MKRIFSAVFLLFAFFCASLPASANDSLADGTYTINYKILKADSDSVSIANDYWEKPAKLIVKNGKYIVQVTLNHSSWIKEFKVSNKNGFADTKVVSADPSANKRVAQFELDQVPDIVLSQIHVYIPEDEFPGEGVYDSRYTIRLKFDKNSIQTVRGNGNGSKEPSASAAAGTSNEKSDRNGTGQQNEADKQTENNPETGDSALLYVFIALFLLSTTFLIIRFKSRFKVL
ncbi:heme uptake protein IsdC [Caldibacillus debilis]|jgi:heme uptake protein IsdC|uniref:Heme uptake protein IsdC n=1 Tax=Caldibacillus debilis GB1 TaxID=1339248 RepID=A0A420VBX0_9BACI|nr:heme uptake protein IsdC [Caldibacillus debilis]RKO61055.1 heme uptake protein IsdC [Caldibacillus debilis GB1]